jgi:hypothetical protein
VILVERGVEVFGGWDCCARGRGVGVDVDCLVPKHRLGAWR